MTSGHYDTHYVPDEVDIRKNKYDNLKISFIPETLHSVDAIFFPVGKGVVVYRESRDYKFTCKYGRLSEILKFLLIFSQV